MLVDVNINGTRPVHEGDLLIANKNGTFDYISKDELLKDLKLQIEELKVENERLMTKINGVSKNTATILKGVIK